jgi:hypothetical protein
VNARRMFYEGTKAYRRADFQTAVKFYRDGLNLWKDLLKNHPSYGNDDINKKDTGLIVKRYKRAFLQAGLGNDLPADTPFLDFLKIAEADTSVDPFDAQEMLPTTPGASAGGGAGAGSAAGGRPATPPPAIRSSTPNVQPLK